MSNIPSLSVFQLTTAEFLESHPVENVVLSIRCGPEYEEFRFHIPRDSITSIFPTMNSTRGKEKGKHENVDIKHLGFGKGLALEWILPRDTPLRIVYLRRIMEWPDLLYRVIFTQPIPRIHDLNFFLVAILAMHLEMDNVAISVSQHIRSRISKYSAASSIDVDSAFDIVQIIYDYRLYTPEDSKLVKEEDFDYNQEVMSEVEDFVTQDGTVESAALPVTYVPMRENIHGMVALAKPAFIFAQVDQSRRIERRYYNAGSHIKKMITTFFAKNFHEIRMSNESRFKTLLERYPEFAKDLAVCGSPELQNFSVGSLWVTSVGGDQI